MCYVIPAYCRLIWLAVKILVVQVLLTSVPEKQVSHFMLFMMLYRQNALT